jgi:endonuclease YncB( thermonuclease family)
MSKTSVLKKIALTAGAIAIVAGSLTVAKRVIDPTETVMSVIDGDTFVISNKQNIRLYGVDAPELGNCFGEEAKDALTKKILGKKVTLKSPRTDYFRRVQAHVYVNNELINEYIALNGYGWDHADGTPESGAIKEAGNYAEANKIGIYSEKCFPTKPPKNCLIKGQISYDQGKHIYRLPGCPDYTQTEIERFRGEDYFCTEKEAIKAGFTKAPNCP